MPWERGQRGVWNGEGMSITFSSFTGLITAPCGHLPVTCRIWALENSHKAILVSPLLLSTISLIKDSSVTFLWLINVSGD